MNEIPVDPKAKFPHTVVYTEAGKAPALENLKHLPVTVSGFEEGEAILALLIPGATMRGICSGHLPPKLTEE